MGKGMANNHMRKGYLIISIASLVIGLATLIVIASILYFPSGGRGIDVQEDEIIVRTGILAQTSDSYNVWRREIESGQLSLADYVRISLTGSDYLLQDRTDKVFANDLAYIAYGTVEQSEEILDQLDGRSRKYVIEKVLSGINSKYGPSRGFSDEKGTRLISYEAENPLQDEVGYAFGLRKISGIIDIDGSEARTDFFVNDDLRPGHLKIETSTSGQQNFSMTWDARKESAGIYNVKVLLRTSDGRGKVITGGQVIIPEFTILQNDRVIPGKVEERENIAWYTLNAEDRDAYINFINVSGDVRVSLYDIYGDLIGMNDLHFFPHEVLRGRKQTISLSDLNLIGLDESANIFYVRVERSPDAMPSVIDIDYTVVVSKNVAIHTNGSILAVIDDIGSVPTSIPYHSTADESDPDEPIKCADVNGEQSSFARSDLRFLPLNGELTSLIVTSDGGTRTYRIYPNFDIGTYDYAYVSETDISEITVGCMPVEGYSAQVTVTKINESLAIPRKDGSVSLSEGENIISVRINSFSGDETEYRLFILNRSTADGFADEVLAKFPAGYRSGLWLLHNLFPDYRFAAYNTGIEWADLVSNQDNKATSLASASSHPQWVKPDSPVYDGSSWKAAKRQVVEFFLDPRNFLTPIHIFQFEKLSFDSSVHTPSGVTEMVRNSFLDEKNPNYPEILYEAGQNAGISPYFLASRIIQEMGRKGQSKLATGTLEGYEGYYNFYNIGSTPNPGVVDGALINGARYAQWGKAPDERQLTEDELALLLPWTSPELAIKGGALWIASSYVDIGQDTLYFQKFDVIENEDGLFRHQYAQNISMAYSESSRYFYAYLSQNMLGSPFLFIIPVYNNMPDHYAGVIS